MLLNWGKRFLKSSKNGKILYTMWISTKNVIKLICSRSQKNESFKYNLPARSVLTFYDV